MKLLSFVPNPRSAGEALQEIKRLDKIEYIKLLDKPSFTYTIRGQDKTFSIDKDDAGTIVKSGVSTDDDLALLNTEFFNWIDQDSQLRKLLSNLSADSHGPDRHSGVALARPSG